MKITEIFLILHVLLSLGCVASIVDAENDHGRRYTGELIAVIADNFEQMKSEMRYHLLPDSGGRMVPLKFKDRRELPGLSTGSRVEIFGRQKGGAIVVESIRILEDP